MHGLFLVLLIILAGCNRPNPYPELKDPIYRDIENDLRNAAREVEAAIKEKDQAYAQIQTAQIQTGEIKAKWSSFYEAEKRLEKVRQKHKYLELRLDSRKTEARKTYQDAFAKGEPWPDPEEFRLYMIAKNAREAPRDWDQRLKLELEKSSRKMAPGDAKTSH
jgi:hypothetical protein